MSSFYRPKVSQESLLDKVLADATYVRRQPRPSPAGTEILYLSLRRWHRLASHWVETYQPADRVEVHEWRTAELSAWLRRTHLTLDQQHRQDPLSGRWSRGPWLVGVSSGSLVTDPMEWQRCPGVPFRRSATWVPPEAATGVPGWERLFDVSSVAPRRW